MDHEAQLKLQAFLDGELPEREAREMAGWVARDAAAADLARELRNTRQALATYEPGVKLPESREFYWSKIERAIERLEPAPPETETRSIMAILRRLFVPASAVAVVFLAVGLAGLHTGVFRSSAGPETELALADPGTFTYHDYADGTTLVWVGYPAER